MKTYYLKFGTGDPASFSGLSPTLIIFNALGLTAIVGPTISEIPSGSGLYQFVYGPTQSILFKADGGSSLDASSTRYISGALDPVQATDEKLGYVTDSIGSTNTDPGSVLGYLRRAQEFWEGNATFIKTTGIWSIFSRGSSTLLATKTLTNNTTQAGKT